MIMFKIKRTFWVLIWLLVIIIGLVNIGWSGTAPEVEWERTFGGSDDDYGYSVHQTLDGGYIIAGYTESFGTGGKDVYLIKTDSDGDVEWEKTFGGSDNDSGESVQQTKDGGYIIVGTTYSYGAGDSDVYLIKIDSDGNLEWSKTFGGQAHDNGRSVQQTTDSGYIIVGDTWSYGAGASDVYLIKTDSDGNLLWSKTFGGPDCDVGYSVEQAKDGGYIIAGRTGACGAGYAEVYLIKTDLDGNVEWEKTFRGKDYDCSVQQTRDDGYIIGTGTGPCGISYFDVYLIKTDSTGDLEWEKTFGGPLHDYAYSVQQTTDGGYIVAGWTESFGAGGGDVYLIKLAGSEPVSPVADFTADKTEGVKPLTVQFTDQSTGDIISWFWEFGDGETSTEQNPIHTYNSTGYFTVSLTVTGPGGSDTETKENYIHVTEVVTHEELAKHWAPVIYQDVDTKWEYNLPTDCDHNGVPENGVDDFITRFDFDGNFNGDDNWEHLSGYETSGLYAYVYYSVIETETHWFLFYGIYHPRDWDDEDVVWPGFQHENDMEGIMLTIRRDGSEYGTIEAVNTYAHYRWFNYPIGITMRPGWEEYDDTVDGVRFFEDHVIVYIQSEGHGIFADKITDRTWDWMINLDPTMDVKIGHWDTEGFPEGTGIVYFCGNNAERAKPIKKDDPNSHYQIVRYQLIEFSELWNKRNNPETFVDFTPGRFKGTSDGYRETPTEKNDNLARAPWGFKDEMKTDFILPGIALSEEGQFFCDPAMVIFGRYNYDLENFSGKYTPNNPDWLRCLRPDLKINSSDGPITLNQSDTLTLTVALDNNGQTENADWWLAAVTPLFDVFFYVRDQGWTDAWVPGYQGPLSYLDSFEVFSMPVSGLPAGTYTLYFGVDTVMDGNVTWDSVYYDTVEVNITD